MFKMRLAFLLPVIVFGLAKAETPANWKANAPACTRPYELLKAGHMDVGVRIATSNPKLAQQFRRALDSWARILDLDWHEEFSNACSVQLLDGQRDLFQPSAVVARAQTPDRPGFQGSIAFNPLQRLDSAELYRISVHEIGHLLGLQHSSKVTSVMYFLDLEGPEWLDPSDLAELAKHHKLRIGALDKAAAIMASAN